jgi:hypothetical protein
MYSTNPTSTGSVASRFPALILVSLMLLATTPLMAAEALPALVQKVQPAIVTVIGYDEDDDESAIGTGFFIEKGLLVTNRHVLEETTRAEIRWNGNSTLPIVRVVAEHPETDLIIVAVDGDTTTDICLPLAFDDPLPGERVVVIGSPFGFEQTVSDGIVSTIREDSPFGRIIQITAPISPGSSGSPVLNMRGEVIGVATVTFAGGQNLNFAIPAFRAVQLPRREPREYVHWAADVHYQNGMKAAEEEDWVSAASSLIRAIRTRPDFTDAFLKLGAVLRELDQNEAAFTALKEAIRLSPDNADAHLHMGHVYVAKEEWQSSLESFEQALRLDSDNAQALYGVGLSHHGLGDRGAALEVFAQLKEIDADLADQLFEKLYARESGEEVTSN